MKSDQAGRRAGNIAEGEEGPLLSPGMERDSSVCQDDVIEVRTRSFCQTVVQNLRVMVENKFYIALFTIATFYTLFADDCRLLWLPKEADPVIHGLMFTAFLLFGARFHLPTDFQPINHATAYNFVPLPLLPHNSH